MARVDINRTRSRAYARDWAEGKKVDPLSRQILRAARIEAPVETGLLRLSLRITKSKNPLRITHRVGSRISYARLVHGGARPHRITPRNPNGFLIFFWKKVGRRVKLREVNHPGFKGVKYLQKPLVQYGTAAGFKVVIFPDSP